MKRQQLTIPINEELRAFIERAAAKEDRSVASMVRRLIAEAARRNSEMEPGAGRTPQHYVSLAVVGGCVVRNRDLHVLPRDGASMD
jgi:hypothetical protein